MTTDVALIVAECLSMREKAETIDTAALLNLLSPIQQERARHVYEVYKEALTEAVKVHRITLTQRDTLLNYVKGGLSL